MNFQIDFIKVGEENWETSKNYFSYNDLGNLMGRLAQRLGVKYGGIEDYFINIIHIILQKNSLFQKILKEFVNFWT